MNWPYFISEKIRRGGSSKNISSPIVKISVAAISLGVAIMIIALAIVSGFKSEVRNKITSFSSHINIQALGNSESLVDAPFDCRLDYLEEIENLPEVKSLHLSTGLGGIIKKEDLVHGIYLKGVSATMDWSLLSKDLLSGEFPNYQPESTSNDIVIPSGLAKELSVDTGDHVIVYFIQERPRVRKFRISAIVENNLENFKNQVYCDIKHLQKVLGWEPYEVGNIEIFLHDFETLNSSTRRVEKIVGTKFLEDGTQLYVEPVTEKFQILFSWLGLFDTNTLVIIVLMIAVALVNMSSGLLILILERAKMIGLLKSLGALNKEIRKIFLYQAGNFILKGLFWGNLIGLSLISLQYYTGIIRLNPESYYVNKIPIQFEVVDWILLNLFTGAVILAFMLIPSMYVSKIYPDRVMKE